jgi:hypothetical protein
VLAAAALIALAVTAAGSAAPAAAPPATGRALGDLFLGPSTARAEVITVDGSNVRDVRLDQGRVAGLTPTALVLVERDGTRQTIPLGPATQIVGKPKTGGRGQPVRGSALAIREGEGPAQTVYLTTGASGHVPTPKTLGQLLMGAHMARAEIVMVARGAVHDFRLDQGRIVSVSPTALIVLERDGTSQTIPVSPATEVWVGDQPATVGALAPKLNVLTVRDGDQPAVSVRAGAVRLPGGRQ